MDANKRRKRKKRRKKKTDESKKESVAQDHLTGVGHSDHAAADLWRGWGGVGGGTRPLQGPSHRLSPRGRVQHLAPLQRPTPLCGGQNGPSESAFDPEPTVHL